MASLKYFMNFSNKHYFVENSDTNVNYNTNAANKNDQNEKGVIGNTGCRNSSMVFWLSLVKWYQCWIGKFLDDTIEAPPGGWGGGVFAPCSLKEK